MKKIIFNLVFILLFVSSQCQAWIFIPSASSFVDVYSALLNGTDEIVQFGDVSDETGDDAFSIGCWVKTSDNASGMLCKGSNIASSPGYCFGMNTGGADPMVTMSMRGTSGAAIITGGTTTNIPSGWAWVSATYTGGRTDTSLGFYVNTTAQTLGHYGNNTLSGSMVNADNLEMGVFRYSGTNYFFTGTLGDCVKIPWVISAAENTELYSSGGPALDMTQFSGWNTMKSDSRSLWITWEADTFDAPSGVTDLTDNGFVASGVNMDNATNKVTDSPP